jgi:hypothetical protein
MDHDTTNTDDETDNGGRLSRRGVLRGSAALGAAPVLASAAGAADAAIGDGPQGIHLAYGTEPTSMMTVAFTGAPGAGRVRYGRPGEMDTTAGASSQPVPGKDAVAYTVTLTGLAPDTEYAYEVALNGTTSSTRRFRTAPAYDSEAGTDGFTIAQVGDHGAADPENPGQRPGDAHPQMVMAIAEALDAEMQLLSGDISYSNGKPSTWERYFDVHQNYYAGTPAGEQVNEAGKQYEDGRPATPFMTIPGNHEAEVGTGMVQYDRRLNDAMPLYDPAIDAVSKRRWWDIVYENAFIMGLNTTADACGDLARSEEFVPLYDPRCETEQGLTYGEVQEQYMREALGRAEANDDVKWKIVFFHGPLWTTSPDHEPRRDLQERWGRVLDEYDVDLVLHGDNHVYERTKPITHTEDLLTYSERRAPPRNEQVQGSAPSPEAAAEGLDLSFETGTTFVVNGTGGVSHYPLSEANELYIEERTNAFFGITRLDIDEERINVQYVAAPPLSEQGADGLDESTPLTGAFDPDRATNADLQVRDEFDIRHTPAGRPFQTLPGMPDTAPGGGTDDGGDPAPTPTFRASGSRADDGSVFRAGTTNRIELSLRANDPIEARDRIPVEWDVVGGDVRTTAPGPGGTQYVRLDATATERSDGSYRLEADYFVEAPGDADDTGRYSFGPAQVRSTDRFAEAGWTAVSGTSSTETVVGLRVDSTF